MRRLFDLVVKKKNPITGKDEKFTGAEMLDMAIFARALKGDVIAYREIMDRVEGKVSQPLDMTMETIQPTTSLTVLHSKIEDEPKGN